VLNLHASGGFVNFGTITVKGIANLPSGSENHGIAEVSATISAGTNFTNNGTIATVASSTFPLTSLRIDLVGTVQRRR
jgi:hypothetical protein